MKHILIISLLFVLHHPALVECGLASWDAANTEINLRSGGHEDWLASQNPNIDAALIMANIPGMYLTRYALRKLRHPKLAKLVPAPFIAVSGSALGYSYIH